MSNGYGVDIYGIPYYGYSQPLDYSVEPFTATQSGYGTITLNWTSPNLTSWKLLHLVRSTYGYPSVPADGQLLLEIVNPSITTSYDDPQLTPGTIYYYTMFIATDYSDWNFATTYALGALVKYNNQYWSSLSSSNTNHTPAAGSAFWQNVAYIPTWLPAGYAATLALGDKGYGTLLYNRTPQPYKITTSDTFSNSQVDNPSLQNYWNVIGYGLSSLKNDYDSYLSLNDPNTVSSYNLDILGQELGLTLEYLASPQQRRQQVANAAFNYKLKGTPQSIHNLIANIAGWDSSVTYSSNMMTNLDQAAFTSPVLDTWNSSTTYFPNQVITYNGYAYKCLVQAFGTNQQPTGTSSSNTWWQTQIAILDNSTLKNPGTNFFGNWYAYPDTANGGNSPTVNGIRTGLPSPTNSANLNAHALDVSTNPANIYTLTLGAPIYNWSTVSGPQTVSISTPAWSNATNYVVGNYVLSGGNYYQAIKRSGPATPYGAVTPGRDDKTWKPVYYVPNDTINLPEYAVPVPRIPHWSPSTQYSAGDQVELMGIIYQAVQDNINSSPTGFYYSNSNWVWVNTADNTVCVSAYFGKQVNDTAVSKSKMKVVGWDAYGNIIQQAVNLYTNQILNAINGMTVRFIWDSSSLAGTTDPGLINAANLGYITGNTWNSNRAITGLWKSSYGMAYVDSSLTGTATYTMLLTNPNTTTPMNTSPWVTLVSDYQDTTHFGHGVVIYSDANNFVYMTRHAFYSVASGVETQLATWGRLQDGDRIGLINDPSSGITPVVYQRDGSGQYFSLASGFSTSFASVQVGLIQKYSTTGAV